MAEDGKAEYDVELRTAAKAAIIVTFMEGEYHTETKKGSSPDLQTHSKDGVASTPPVPATSASASASVGANASRSASTSASSSAGTIERGSGQASGSSPNQQPQGKSKEEKKEEKNGCTVM
jgi:hypothetical protein